MLVGNCLFIQTYILAWSFRMVLKAIWGNDSWQHSMFNKAPGWVNTDELTYSM